MPANPHRLSQIRNALGEFRKLPPRVLIQHRDDIEQAESLARIEPLDRPRGPLRPLLDLYRVRKLLESELETRPRSSSLSSFFTSVGESLALAQRRIGRASAAYRRDSPPLPAQFTIPSVRAELSFDVEAGGDEGIRALFYKRSEAATRRENHRVSFELTAAPAPIEAEASVLRPRPLSADERAGIAACLDRSAAPELEECAADLRGERWRDLCWCLSTGPDCYTLLAPPSVDIEWDSMGPALRSVRVIQVPKSLEGAPRFKDSLSVPTPLRRLLGAWLAPVQPWLEPTRRLTELLDEEDLDLDERGWSVVDGLEDITVACGLDIPDGEESGRLSQLFTEVADGVVAAQRELDAQAAIQRREGLGPPLLYRIPKAHAEFRFAVERMHGRTIKLLVHRESATHTSSEQFVEFDVLSGQQTLRSADEPPAAPGLPVAHDPALREQLRERLAALRPNQFTRRLTQALAAKAIIFATPSCYIVALSRRHQGRLRVTSMVALRGPGQQVGELDIHDVQVQDSLWRPLVEDWLAPPLA